MTCFHNFDTLIGSTLVDRYATCGSLSYAYKLFIHLDLMAHTWRHAHTCWNHGLRHTKWPLYHTRIRWPKCGIWICEYEHDEEDWFASSICKFMVCLSYWGSAQSSLSNEGFMVSNCLTQDGLGKDSHFLSIYFVICSWYAF